MNEFLVTYQDSGAKTPMFQRFVGFINMIRRRHRLRSCEDHFKQPSQGIRISEGLVKSVRPKASICWWINDEFKAFCLYCDWRWCLEGTSSAVAAGSGGRTGAERATRGSGLPIAALAGARSRPMPTDVNRIECSKCSFVYH
jgi:hypothetical protein